MNHKRRRPKRSRAGCYCGHKLAKSEMGMARGAAKTYGASGRSLRLRERARDVDADEASGDPCRDGTCRECAEVMP